MGQNFDSEVKMWKSDIENHHLMTEMHGWKKYFSFWDRGSKTLKFSASFALFQVEYVVI